MATSKSGKKLRVTLVKSPFGTGKNHMACVRGLGLRRMHDSRGARGYPVGARHDQQGFTTWLSARKSDVRLNTLKPGARHQAHAEAPRSRHRSGLGKTSGKGHKGQTRARRRLP